MVCAVLAGLLRAEAAPAGSQSKTLPNDQDTSILFDVVPMIRVVKAWALVESELHIHEYRFFAPFISAIKLDDTAGAHTFCSALCQCGKERLELGLIVLAGWRLGSLDALEVWRFS